MEVTEAWNTLKERIIANNNEDVVNEFEMLGTDEERIIFTLNIMLKYDILPIVSCDAKNAKESERLRERGNKVFVSSPLTSTSCVEALKLYTKSIVYAPYPSEQLALGYANRSAVLIKLHKYEECVRDINRALALQYPDNLKAKIYARKIDCFEVLKHPTMEDAIKEAQEWLNKISFSNVHCKNLNEKLISKEEMGKSYNSKEQNDAKCKNKSPFPVLKTRNIKIPCISDALTLMYNKQYGRHIVATRKINPGEIIAIEKPYSLLLSPANMYTHCSNCLELSWANIPCDYCIYAMYCSEECKILGWKKYHDMECSVYPCMMKMNFSTSQLFSLRLAIQAMKEASSIQELREELKEVDDCNDSCTKGFSKNGIFEGDKYRSLWGLDTHKEDAKDRLFIRSLNASFILYILATYTNMFGNPLKKDISMLAETPDVTFIGSLILRHQQLIPCNRHGISEMPIPEMHPLSRGSAIMPSMCFINHSCDPNIARITRSGYMIMSALYPIEKGEQIFDSYSQLYVYVPKAVRQKYLLEKYYFQCNCLPCQENWPLFNDLKSCVNLDLKKEILYEANQVLKKFRTYRDDASKGNILDGSSIANDIIKMINILYYQTPKPCLEVSKMIEALKCVFYLTGNRYEIPKL
ncbi:SET and MYND domain-containing protein 4-like [Hylaeus anthracinus]|uniref:SET and MYND domain-containing protein 4-like n=1 Tax=Hylaeus anthracinus TaxID=313031 RepID=UPI0023B8B35B|nr:SET and MYND domain-containing protein 4-like [Hylaeus anthracinus]XP_054001175.1 SET and MYND domain-containing protein 4-like [Hylaeus anthracinus]